MTLARAKPSTVTSELGEMSPPAPRAPQRPRVEAAGACCVHCGSAIAASVLALDPAERFCCGGCRAAYSLITGEGLEEYYALRRRFSERDPKSIDPQLSEATFVDLDAPRFFQNHVVSLPGGTVQSVLRLQGIHCAACVWLLERLPQLREGVIESRVNLPRGTIELTWDPARVQLSQVARQIARLGYRAVPLVNSQRERAQQAETRRQLVQIAIAGACAGNVMLLAVAIYCGQWSGMAADHLQLLRVASTAVGLVSLLGPGAIFFRGAWSAIRTGVPHMDVPVALGLGVGAASGAWNTLVGSGELYYDSLSMLVFFLLIGRALQSWQQRTACQAVDLLQQLTPATALRVRDGAVETIPIEAVEAGDILEVRAGQTLAVDGVVISGTSQIDTSILTGESVPATVVVGSPVIAGTLNRSRTLRIRAERVGPKTRLGTLLDAIERAGIGKAPIVQWADRISAVFVRVVLALAVVVGALWWIIEPEVWSERVVAVLIVACPCALGLATPLAIAVGLGSAARRGVLIKGGDTLQRLSQAGILVLDKTGTLTEGRLSVLEWSGSHEALAAAAAVEADNAHPVAEAVREFFRASGSDIEVQANDCEYLLGSGISGRVDGREVLVGNRDLFARRSYRIPDSIDARLAVISDRGQSPLLVGVAGVVEGVAAIGDTLRPEAPEIVQRLQRRGWDVRILSGDHEPIVQQVGRMLGFSSEQCLGGVSPEEKLGWIRQYQSSGKPVIMVGDGVNDAAALAAADVGIAVRGGAEASLQAADVYLAGGSLCGIEEIMNTAARTLRIIRRNSRASLMYNMSSVTLAAIGWLHPLAAALLMPASSLTVVSITLWGYAGRAEHSSARTPGAQA